MATETIADAPFAIGALVQYRRRDWVVERWDADLQILTLRPVAGTEQERIDVYWPMARAGITAGQWPPPDPAQPGDFVSGALLRDAARLSVRHPAGPLRVVATCAVWPRPYQLVPLSLALRQQRCVS